MKTLIALLVILGINTAIPASARDYLEDLKNGGPEYAPFLKFEMEIRAKLDPEALALRHQYKQCSTRMHRHGGSVVGQSGQCCQWFFSLSFSPLGPRLI